MKAQEDAMLPTFDANDWIYQTWAYETHDLGTTPGMNGDLQKALRAIKAKTFIRIEAEDAGREPGDESLPSQRLGWRSQIGFLIC